MIWAAIGGVILLVVGIQVWRQNRARGQSDGPGPHNNWRNQDFEAREKAGNWSEGSTASRTGTGGVTNTDYGAGL
jgi:hypothetical protein